MTKELIKSADIGSGWFAQAYSDGSATVRNVDKGQRIDLPKESVDRFLEIWRKVREPAPLGATEIIGSCDDANAESRL
jgi:hypothetical protein